MDGLVGDEHFSQDCFNIYYYFQPISNRISQLEPQAGEDHRSAYIGFFHRRY